jgi:hypothetical protein
MKGTMDVLYCDAEEGCGEWMPDYYAMDVSNWRDLLKGWTYNPYQDREAALCRYHSPQAVAAREAGYPEFRKILFQELEND